ncbi:MAG: hypothetical protein NUV57_04815 [archaeon]|nr:hypothetical protein [archaeon]
MKYTAVLISTALITMVILSGCANQTASKVSENTTNQNNATQNNEFMEDATDNHMDDSMEDGDMMKENNIIIYTDAGFAPNPLTIKTGDSVTWINNSSMDMWPATAMHPTHTAYPGSGIQKCGTDEEPGIFDACRGIAPGESYTFTFNETGEWAYHDHLTPSNFGKIIAES